MDYKSIYLSKKTADTTAKDLNKFKPANFQSLSKPEPLLLFPSAFVLIVHREYLCRSIMALNGIKIYQTVFLII